MSNPDRVEFYDGDKLLIALDSSMIPPVGTYISIRGKTWRIKRFTFAVDQADKIFERQMRCNVDLENVKP